MLPLRNSQDADDSNSFEAMLVKLNERHGASPITQAYFFGRQEYRNIATIDDLKLLLEDRLERDQSLDALASLHLYHTCRLPDYPLLPL